MVKRDHSPAVLIGLSKIAALSCLALWLYVIWQVLSIGLSQLTLETLFVLVVGPFATIYFFKGAEWQQWRRVEMLRRNPKAATLYSLQPAGGETQVSFPLIVSVRLSSSVYLSFALFWLVLSGLVFLFFRDSLMTETPLLLLIWVLVGSSIMGFIGILSYQRIEVTHQGFFVQTGLRKHSIPWEEATLFAALWLMDPKGSPVHYELSSARAILRWQINRPGAGFRTTPPQKQAYETLLNAIHASICTRTGLPLLDVR